MAAGGHDLAGQRPPAARRAARTTASRTPSRAKRQRDAAADADAGARHERGLACELQFHDGLQRVAVYCGATASKINYVTIERPASSRPTRPGALDLCH